jgi:hypothetical protein
MDQQQQQPDEHMKPAAAPLFFAVRKCDTLKGPAIFLAWDDCSSFVGIDANETHVPEYKSFQVLTDAMAYISNTYSFTSPQASRKRSAQESFMEEGSGSASSRKKSLKIFEQGENFEERIHQWQAYKNMYSYDPTDSNKMDEDDGLGTWVDALKRRYDDFLHERHTCQLTNSKIPCLTKTQADLITKSGLWDPVRSDKESSRTNPLWSTRLSELVAYKAKTGDTLVPTSNPGLLKWIYQQRKEYKKFALGQKAYMNEERAATLKEAGFVFDPSKLPKEEKAKPTSRKRKKKTPTESTEGDNDDPVKKKLRTWEKSFERLADYKRRHGNCLIPKRYPPDSALGSWVDTQRKAYKKFRQGQKSSTNEERIAKLIEVGFVFAPKAAPHSQPQSAGYQAPPQVNNQDEDSDTDGDEDVYEEAGETRQAAPQRNSVYGSTFAPWERYSIGRLR